MVCLKNLLVIVSILFLPIYGAGQESELVAKVEFSDAQQIFYLPNIWKYSKDPISSITLENYQDLPEKQANGANGEYLSMQEAGAEGAYVLRIESENDIRTSILFKNFASSNQILLINDSGVQKIYQHPKYHLEIGSYHRVQQTNIMADLNLIKGTNFLVLNHKFLPYLRQGKEWSNIGFGHFAALGDKTKLTNTVLSELASLKIPLGVFFCLSIYSLLIYFSRKRQDHESLLLFLVNVTMFTKEFASQKVFTDFMDSNFFTQVFGTLVFATPILSSYGMIGVVRMTLENNFLKWLSRITLVNCTFSLVFSVGPHLFSFFPFNIPANTFCALVNFVCVILLLTPYSIYHSIKTRHYEITSFAVGISIFGMGVVLDMVNAMNAYNWPWLSMWGGMIFSLILAKNNSKKFADTYAESEKLNKELSVKNKEVEQLNQSLERKVEERTAEIQSLLRYIPQGIFSIGSDGMVEPNYSAQLPKILGHDKIAGASAYDLIFKNSKMAEDDSDQAWQAVLASIGEDALNFDANLDKLPTMLDFVKEDDNLSLKLTWNVEVDEHDEVKHILVTVLDSTQEMKAKRELEEKNQDFEVIRQLVDAGPKKAAQFFSTSQVLLGENKEYVSDEELSEESLKILFVNAHTLKGAARTLQFRAISNHLHRVESIYGRLLRGEDLNVGPRELLDDIQSVENLIDRYQTVNHDVLGRSRDYSTINIDRDFLEDNFRIFQFLESDDGKLPEDIREIVHSNSTQLVQIIFTDLGIILTDIMSQVPKIAGDLKKEVPIVEIDCPEVFITHSQETLLRNCLLHLLRNSIDHGLETGPQRSKAGKDPAGTINLKVEEKGNVLHISLKDDGKGIAIGQLRSMGESTGKLQKDADIHDVADLIFSQGVSTAKKVTQISGRGVGMDAVRRFLEAQGGGIFIDIGEPKDKDHQFYSFSFKLELPIIEMKSEHFKAEDVG